MRVKFSERMVIEKIKIIERNDKILIKYTTNAATVFIVTKIIYT